MMYFTQIPSLNSSHLPLTLFILFNEYKFADHIFVAQKKKKAKRGATLLPNEERRKKKNAT